MLMVVETMNLISLIVGSQRLLYGIHGRLRPFFVRFHKVLGALVPVIGYVQIVLGVIASVGFCYGDSTGQCLAHFIMGSSFVGYGILLLLSLRVGGPWLLRRGKSQEWFDSWVIMLWGIVNTFTEHRWGQDWNHGDYQHTSMGIIWWIAGLVGIVLSRNGNRSVVPSVLIILTAVAFQGHAQHVPNSGQIHSYFGYMLMAGGLSRIIEICFVWKEGEFSISPWQYLPPLTLILAGHLFMGSTEEQLMYLNGSDIDVSSYSNILLSFGFAVFLFALALILLWEKLTRYDPSTNTRTQPDDAGGDYSELPLTGPSNLDTETLHDTGSDFLEDDDDRDDAMELKTRVRNGGPHHL
ncbi:hypothetical protein BDA99DRAFT_494697 [Phascolomyces articulosus]|uniref:Protein YTP1-like C-terminal domain-containing protein n=1 Tax=Phascolomyces articulosus TaxID=60185 RepID=A0AAD5KB34_9FUNG|nr:hypothetical protein BDA99DRAFT_494697 [Phascolomyces articulosus]